MSVHKLEFEDSFLESFNLYAIHCNIEDFRLAYSLNKYLGLKFKRCSKDITFDSSESSYSVFEYEDKKSHVLWSLISNTSRVEIADSIDSNSEFLFDSLSVNFSYLLKELPQVNFFLKITLDEGLTTEKSILNKIQAIPQIVVTYPVDINKVKKINNLIY
jgi:hypothetical protein